MSTTYIPARGYTLRLTDGASIDQQFTVTDKKDFFALYHINIAILRDRDGRRTLFLEMRDWPTSRIEAWAEARHPDGRGPAWHGWMRSRACRYELHVLHRNARGVETWLSLGPALNAMASRTGSRFSATEPSLSVLWKAIKRTWDHARNLDFFADIVHDAIGRAKDDEAQRGKPDLIARRFPGREDLQ